MDVYIQGKNKAYKISSINLNFFKNYHYTTFYGRKYVAEIYFCCSSTTAKSKMLQQHFAPLQVTKIILKARGTT